MALADFTFFHSLRVRWTEVDMQAVVFNGHYLFYFDVALTEYWRKLGLSSPLEQAKNHAELFVKKAVVEYHHPAKFDDNLLIGVRSSIVGKTSIVIVLEIFRASASLVSGAMTYVYVDTTASQSIPLPQAWIKTIAAYEIATPLQNKY